MESYLNALRDFLTVESLTIVTFSVSRVLVIVIGAMVMIKMASRFVRLIRANIVEVMKRHRPGDSSIQLEKRAATIGAIIRKTIAVIIWGVGVVMILRELNFDVAPILAGAGVVGLAVGFGAQNLVRDVISGLFMLVENQISVNDIVIINGTGGLVEEVNLRTTVLRGLDGTVHIFPNGAITTLSNMTHEFSYYVFDVGVAYKEDTDRVVDVLKEIAAEMRQSENYGQFITEPLDVLGVDQFGESAVVIKVRIKTLPAKQWQVGREMNRRIKKRFDAEGIEIPFPHRSIHFGEAFKLELSGSTRNELKQAVREVMDETRAGPHRATSGRL